jgi:hypothetical protein
VINEGYHPARQRSQGNAKVHVSGHASTGELLYVCNPEAEERAAGCTGSTAIWSLPASSSRSYGASRGENTMSK